MPLYSLFRLQEPYDLDHTHPGWWKPGTTASWTDLHRLRQTLPWLPTPTCPRAEIQPYWTMAAEYTLADRMFQSNTGPSFVAHQYMIAGQSVNLTKIPSHQRGLGMRRSSGTTVHTDRTERHGPSRGFPVLRLPDDGRFTRAKGMTWRYYAPANRRRRNSTCFRL